MLPIFCWRCHHIPSFWPFFQDLSQIWRFPEIGVPLVVIHFNRFFHERNHSYSGTHHLWKSPFLGDVGHQRHQRHRNVSRCWPCELQLQLVAACEGVAAGSAARHAIIGALPTKPWQDPWQKHGKTIKKYRKMRKNGDLCQQTLQGYDGRAEFFRPGSRVEIRTGNPYPIRISGE